MKRWAQLAAVFFLAGGAVWSDEPAPAPVSDSTPQPTEIAAGTRNDLMPVPTAELMLSTDATVTHCNLCGRDIGRCTCGINWTISADFLYLQTKGADIGYGVPSDDCFGVPLGPTEQLNFDFQAGVRYGIWRSWSPGMSWIGLTGAHFNADSSEQGIPSAQQIFQPILLVSPNPLSCPAGSATFAIGQGEVEFNTYDLDYKQLLFGTDSLDITGIVGLRIADMDQSIRVTYDEDTVRSAADIRGAGLRFGVAAERHVNNWHFFGSSNLSILNVDMDELYTQTSVTDGVVVDFEQDIDRLIPIMDLQVGVSYDVCRNISMALGYQYSVWWNVVTVPSLINSLQAGDFSGETEEDITFDGFFARVEVRF